MCHKIIYFDESMSYTFTFEKGFNANVQDLMFIENSCSLVAHLTLNVFIKFFIIKQLELLIIQFIINT